jgi:hypothetical protein
LFDLWQYWYALVGAFLGAWLAIFLERRKDDARRAFAKKHLKSRVGHNHNLLVDAIGYLRLGGKPFFKMDPDGINLWLTQSAYLLDEALVAEIEAFRHELEHINNKMVTFAVVTGIRSGKQNSPAAVIAINLREEADLKIVVHMLDECKRAEKILAMMD